MINVSEINDRWWGSACKERETKFVKMKNEPKVGMYVLELRESYGRDCIWSKVVRDFLDFCILVGPKLVVLVDFSLMLFEDQTAGNQGSARKFHVDH